MKSFITLMALSLSVSAPLAAQTPLAAVQEANGTDVVGKAVSVLQVMFEQAPMERLAADGQLMAYKHHGFWQCMDTLREKHLLEELWASGKAPWASWL